MNRFFTVLCKTQHACACSLPTSLSLNVVIIVSEHLNAVS